MKPLPKSFYERDPATVAKELLGKTLVRRLSYQTLSGKIVETEAYYGVNDPASKAYKGRKIFNELMFLDVGKAFIYMKHGNVARFMEVFSYFLFRYSATPSFSSYRTNSKPASSSFFSSSKLVATAT